MPDPDALQVRYELPTSRGGVPFTPADVVVVPESEGGGDDSGGAAETTGAADVAGKTRGKAKKAKKAKSLRRVEMSWRLALAWAATATLLAGGVLLLLALVLVAHRDGSVDARSLEQAALTPAQWRAACGRAYAVACLQGFVILDATKVGALTLTSRAVVPPSWPRPIVRALRLIHKPITRLLDVAS